MPPRSCKVLFLGCMFSSTASTRITRCSWSSPHAGTVGLQLRAAALTFRANSRTRLHVCGVSLQPQKTSATSARTSHRNQTFTGQISKKKCFISMNQRKRSPKKEPQPLIFEKFFVYQFGVRMVPIPKGVTLVNRVTSKSSLLHFHATQRRPGSITCCLIVHESAQQLRHIYNHLPRSR